MKHLAWIVIFAGPLLFAQASQGQFTFKFNNPQLDPASYSMTVNEKGEGHFHSEPGTNTSSKESPLPAEDRNIHLSPALTSQIFTTAREVHFFAISCEDGKGKIAFQGNKTLAYEGPDGHGSCEFNWSKDPRIQKLADQLIAVASTLNVGQRLESKHQYDRLALDEELQSLNRMVANGQAAELSNISETLQSIINDPSIVGRARRIAKALLNGEKLPVR